MNNKELLKEKRSKLLNELINKIKESIDKNKIDKEVSSKIFIYSRLADYTYYSEVSIRKFLTGIVPKDISSFIEGISQYCKLVKVEDEYIEKFATEYIKLANAIVLELDSLIKTKNNLPPQDLTTIIRPRKLQNFIENFLKENVNISYIYGYKLSGKTKSIMAIMNDLINKSIYDNVIWIDIKENDKKINKIFDVIASFISKEETKIEEEVKKDECLKFLKSSNSILVIDFNNIKIENQTLYILKEIAQNTKIIIISSNNFKYYEDYLLSYSKVFCTNEYIEKDEFKNLLMNNNYTNANILNEQKFIDELYKLTGGMPFATISIIRKIIEENELGVPLKDSLEKYSNYKLKIYEDLAEKIIEENWNELDDLAKKIIIISSKFNYSISIKLIAYICEVDIKSDRWKSSIKKCYDNNLLNHIILNNPRVYVNNMIKKLVLQYEEKEKFDNKNFLEKLANYYLNLSTYIGECYNNLDKLKLLDDFDCWNIVQEVLDYLMKNNMDRYYINIVRELKYYIYVRGIWQKGDDSLHLKRAHLAYKNGYINDYIEALCDYINICSKSRNNDDALKYINIVNKLVEENKDKIDKRIICLCNHVNALYLYNCKKDYFKCYNIWKDNKANYSNYVSKYRNLVNDLWLTRCYIKIETDNKKIISLLESKIIEMRNENFVRAELDYELLLIGFLVKSIIDFNVDDNLIEEIEKELDKCHLLLNTKSNKDIRNEAQYFKYKTIVYFYKNEKKEADEFLEKAIKKYELINCYYDIKELREYINNIKDYKIG